MPIRICESSLRVDETNRSNIQNLLTEHFDNRSIFCVTLPVRRKRRRWLREKESNLRFLRSKRSVLPVTPSRKSKDEGGRMKDERLTFEIKLSQALHAFFILPPSSFLLCPLVGALGFEPRTLRLSGANTVYKTAALPLSYAPKASSKS